MAITFPIAFAVAFVVTFVVAFAMAFAATAAAASASAAAAAKAPREVVAQQRVRRDPERAIETKIMRMTIHGRGQKGVRQRRLRPCRR